LKLFSLATKRTAEGTVPVEETPSRALFRSKTVGPYLTTPGKPAQDADAAKLGAQIATKENELRLIQKQLKRRSDLAAGPSDAKPAVAAGARKPLAASSSSSSNGNGNGNGGSSSYISAAFSFSKSLTHASSGDEMVALIAQEQDLRTQVKLLRMTYFAIAGVQYDSTRAEAVGGVDSAGGGGGGGGWVRSPRDLKILNELNIAEMAIPPHWIHATRCVKFILIFYNSFPD
jgi:hypothetical protein